MSPQEQLHAELLDERVQNFAIAKVLCVTLSIPEVYICHCLKVPFEARSMAELKSKVMAGRVQPVSGPYSNALKNICMSMMQLDPAKRPSLTELLNVPEVQSRLARVPGAKEADEVAPILKTIVVPKNLRNLSTALPDAAYDAIPADK